LRGPWLLQGATNFVGVKLANLPRSPGSAAVVPADLLRLELGDRLMRLRAAPRAWDRCGVDPAALFVQPVVRSKARSLGADGDAWLARLPHVLAELERRWSLEVLRSLSGGTAAYVGLARTGDGGTVVLKLPIPDPDFADEIGTLARAAGRGYARLLAHDTSRNAILLEALGPSLSRSGLPPQDQIKTLCRVLGQAWTVRPAATGRSARAHNKAADLDRLVRRLWAQLDRPCSEAAVSQALRYATRRAEAFHPDRCVVVHGDAAPANALQVAPRPGAEAGFVFVDPDGFLGDPAYDLGVALRDWSPQLLASDHPATLARHYCRLLAAESGTDDQAIWEWGFLERVSTGMFALAFGADGLARPLLRTAERLVGA